MTLQELINAVYASDMETEARLETIDILQWRMFEEEEKNTKEVKL